MKYQFKFFAQIAPARQSMSGDGSFIHSVVFFIQDTETNQITSQMAEIGVPGTTTLADSNPFIMSQIMMRINAMNNH